MTLTVKNERTDDREQIIACYKAMYDGMIRKDIEYLKEYLDESYELIHMTGVRMDRQEYFDAMLDGTLNYYSCEHKHISVSISGDTAELTGDTRVSAAVYGGSRRFWNLRLTCTLIRKGGKWRMTRSAASTFL